MIAKLRRRATASARAVSSGLLVVLMERRVLELVVIGPA